MVRFCVTGGCRGVVPLDDAIIATLKAGRQGQVLFQDAQRREVGVPLSLLGVTAGLAALAYASDAAAFLTEAYVHPGPRIPPPETGRDDLAPGLVHAIVAVLVYALLARRRRCCESKQRSGKRE